ncbi:DEAD/DEAH box helicase [Spirochaetia bacterium]|nr:DEAD/DEAH box helicase [Spirochaetia bacterium]
MVKKFFHTFGVSKQRSSIVLSGEILYHYIMSLSFHSLIRAWFTETYGAPTAVQAAAWPLIEQGEHVLALAPTGSGKTLTAFLAALSRFASGIYPADKLTVLYISPLKALNEDIRRNLTDPLEGIRTRFAAAGETFPDVRAETRSGDTPQGDRRRLLIKPPSILALTPESLAILLLNPKGRAVLSTVKYVILDEIHSVIGTKRGSFLSCQIDRLSLVAGEFQRVSLSATVRPPEIAAEFIGGIRAVTRNGKTVYEKRPVKIAAPATEKRIEFIVEYGDEEIVDRILKRIAANRTTLVFTGSRRQAERLSFLINQRAEKTISFAHHGSLSKELRQTVERRLAEGTLPCVVATSSLELGIDIGSVDEVILAGSPGSVSQTLQRIGRSGHGVGRTSRGKLYPYHGMDLLLAAALAGAVNETNTGREIEASAPIENPLDILAQIILALCVEKNRNIDELYETLRGFYVFRNLGRPVYERVVRMLAGIGKKNRLRELKPRLYIDELTGELSAADGALLLLYSSGGVIPSRGLFSLRLAGSTGTGSASTGNGGTKIGELDEEFVWERRIGDRFDFGNRPWKIVSIGSEAVEVIPLDKGSGSIPFWKADPVFRSPLLSRRIIELLEKHQRDNSLDSASLPGVTEPSVDALNHYLDSQKIAQGDCPLPHSNTITVEIISEALEGANAEIIQAVIYTFRGGALNYPLSLALAQEIEEGLELRVETFCDDNGILFFIPRNPFPLRRISGEADTAGIEELIRECLEGLSGDGGGGLSRGERQFRRRLESSSRFGASFREAAERSLLLPRSGFGRRTPLWMLRQRSKRLFDAVSREDDFPVTAEAWRSCLQDQFDMEGFRELIEDLRDKRARLSFFRTRTGSPFSRSLTWQETNSLMYEYDERPDLRSRSGLRSKSSLRGGSNIRGNTNLQSGSLSDQAIAEALGDANLRPKIPAVTAADFTARLRREIPGWAPDDEKNLAEWVKERIAIPLNEWETLCAALPAELREKIKSDPTLGDRIHEIKRNNAAIPSIIHRDWQRSWLSEFTEQGNTQQNYSQTDLLQETLQAWLRYEGPLSISRIADVFGIGNAEAEDAVNALAAGTEDDAGEVVLDVAVSGIEENLICDRENLDLLLRLTRRDARPVIQEKSASLLVPFIALRQGLASQTAQGELTAAFPWKFLTGIDLPVKLWETDIFPARCKGYTPELLDREIHEGHLVWYGAGKERAGFCKSEDLDLVLDPDAGSQSSAEQETVLPGEDFFDRKRDFWEIRDAVCAAQSNSRGCTEAIWREAWRGKISADSWEPVRRGIEFGFVQEEISVPDLSGEANSSPLRTYRRLPRALRDKWKQGAPVSGSWYSIDLNGEGGKIDPGNQDPLDEEELNRDRIRLLLDRWGILCRPLLERESPLLSWSRLLPVMRRMELAGELVAGRFFSGINSLQFASPKIVKDMEEAESFKGIFWMNATDPASPAGLGIEGLDPKLPARSIHNRLYYRGSELVTVSTKNGKELQIFIKNDDPDLSVMIGLLKMPRLRKVHPEKKLAIETINSITAARSDYAKAFIEAHFVEDRGKLFLW